MVQLRSQTVPVVHVFILIIASGLTRGSPVNLGWLDAQLTLVDFGHRENFLHRATTTGQLLVEGRSCLLSRLVNLLGFAQAVPAGRGRDARGRRSGSGRCRGDGNNAEIEDD